MKGKTGFKIEIKDGQINIASKVKNIVPYWKKETLQKSFEKKYKELLYVKAESRGTQKNEEFHFNEAWLMKGFDFKNFVKLIENESIFLKSSDIRISSASL